MPLPVHCLQYNFITHVNIKYWIMFSRQCTQTSAIVLWCTIQCNSILQKYSDLKLKSTIVIASGEVMKSVIKVQHKLFRLKHVQMNNGKWDHLCSEIVETWKAWQWANVSIYSRDLICPTVHHPSLPSQGCKTMCISGGKWGRFIHTSQGEM